jgi:hypothetical protein
VVGAGDLEELDSADDKTDLLVGMAVKRQDRVWFERHEVQHRSGAERASHGDAGRRRERRRPVQLENLHASGVSQPELVSRFCVVAPTRRYISIN